MKKKQYKLVLTGAELDLYKEQKISAFNWDLIEQTELNKELNALNDGDLIDAKYVELGYKGVKLEDMDAELFSNLIDSFVTYKQDYANHREEIKSLKAKNSNHEDNIKNYKSQIELQKTYNKELDEKCYKSNRRVEELESIIETFKILANKIR